MKIALGTVQFGLRYGAFNARGQVSQKEAGSILDQAAAAGIDTLDTAQAYGESEQVLGRLNAAGRFRIISKCPPLTDPDNAGDILRRAVDQSCKNLATDRLAGFLLHRAEDLTGPSADSVWKALESLRAEGRVEKIGVSAYDAPTLRQLCRSFPLDMAQIPANVLDPWYEDARLPYTLELHVRSVFLQGFLLSNPAHLSGFHQQWQGVLEDFRARAAELGVSPLQAALAPLLNSPQIDRLVLGVDSASQLREILAATATSDISSLGTFDHTSPSLLDPRTWPQ